MKKTSTQTRQEIFSDLKQRYEKIVSTERIPNNTLTKDLEFSYTLLDKEKDKACYYRNISLIAPLKKHYSKWMKNKGENYNFRLVIKPNPYIKFNKKIKKLGVLTKNW